MDIRLAILPFLSAENDVQSDFLHERIKLNEAELMKDVAGWGGGRQRVQVAVHAPDGAAAHAERHEPDVSPRRRARGRLARAGHRHVVASRATYVA